ncbi:uncharacterized protein BDZ99DRAFT_104304 [Mytilinidion resinicola]|uniref:Uncharacterized protein n=1 Tax=Mytilinidion resinicola TaxID=574789 RepID=A0A6A6YC12_9PEZI|nr:uncharacterized protein BDZ99DRAFT_104304 [Mytilinidion resinicola]KAF2806118.1 hypothetical protein BDZ99DRAFT_104304 [Mytilinidion resinicola]
MQSPENQIQATLINCARSYEVEDVDFRFAPFQEYEPLPITGTPVEEGHGENTSDPSVHQTVMEIEGSGSLEQPSENMALINVSEKNREETGNAEESPLLSNNRKRGRAMSEPINSGAEAPRPTLRRRLDSHANPLRIPEFSAVRRTALKRDLSKRKDLEWAKKEVRTNLKRIQAEKVIREAEKEIREAKKGHP